MYDYYHCVWYNLGMAKKKAQAKRSTGRRSLYKPELDDYVERLAMLGLKDTELAHALKITERTLNNWKRRYPSFFQSIKNGRLEADGNVARALYSRAMGATIRKQQVFKLQRVFWENGKRCSEDYIEIVEYEEQVPPDTGAIAFWLKNRRPDKWREKPVPEITTEQSDSFVSALKAGARLWDMPAVEPEDDAE